MFMIEEITETYWRKILKSWMKKTKEHMAHLGHHIYSTFYYCTGYVFLESFEFFLCEGLYEVVFLCS